MFFHKLTCVGGPAFPFAAGGGRRVVNDDSNSSQNVSPSATATMLLLGGCGVFKLAEYFCGWCSLRLIDMQCLSRNYGQIAGDLATSLLQDTPRHTIGWSGPSELVIFIGFVCFNLWNCWITWNTVRRVYLALFSPIAGEHAIEFALFSIPNRLNDFVLWV